MIQRGVIDNKITLQMLNRHVLLESRSETINIRLKRQFFVETNENYGCFVSLTIVQFEDLLVAG